MKRVQIYLTEEQHKQLKMIYALTGKKVSETIRDSINDTISRNKDLQKMLSGKTIK